jgi:hypothetical protein
MEAMPNASAYLVQLEREGYTLLPEVFTSEAIAEMVAGLRRVFAARAGEEASIRGNEGTIYAARNVLQLWPVAANVCRV